MSTTFLKLNVYCYQYFCKQVAIICHSLPDVPRKGNVDRNITREGIDLTDSRTFPARGTWIEIAITMYENGERVGRSPQGERG